MVEDYYFTIIKIYSDLFSKKNFQHLILKLSNFCWFYIVVLINFFKTDYQLRFDGY